MDPNSAVPGVPITDALNRFRAAAGMLERIADDSTRRCRTLCIEPWLRRHCFNATRHKSSLASKSKLSVSQVPR
jgi:hypothetical protein